MREIRIRWTTPAGSDNFSILYFDDTVASVAVQRGSIDTMLDGLAPYISSQVSWAIETSGRVLDESTGTLTGFWADAAPYLGVGGNAAQPVADATQVLLQWRTGQIIAGRHVRGRTYIPGFGVNQLMGGNLIAATVSGVGVLAQNFATAINGFGVWHRPTPSGSGGDLLEVITGGAWSELAVQRRRRG